jgi:hypothetical protein
MQERAAEQLATRSVHPTNGSCNQEERTAKSEDQASRQVCLQHSIYSHGNTGEYLAHIVAVLRIIKQKGLNVQCRYLGKAVVKLTGTFKDLLKAAGSKETVLFDNDLEACKLEIEETQKMLQEAQKQQTRQSPRRMSS